jgi:hypothetical protein
MDQITDPSRKISITQFRFGRNQTLSISSQSAAANVAKIHRPFPTSRKSSSMRCKRTNNTNSGSSDSCYSCRTISMGLSISHWRHPCKPRSQTGRDFFHACMLFGGLERDQRTIDRRVALAHHLPWAKYTMGLTRNCPLGFRPKRYSSWRQRLRPNKATSIVRQRMAAHSKFLTKERLFIWT